MPTRHLPVAAALRDGLQASGDLDLFVHRVGNTAQGHPGRGAVRG